MGNDHPPPATARVDAVAGCTAYTNWYLRQIIRPNGYQPVEVIGHRPFQSQKTNNFEDCPIAKVYPGEIYCRYPECFHTQYFKAPGALNQHYRSKHGFAPPVLPPGKKSHGRTFPDSLIAEAYSFYETWRDAYNREMAEEARKNQLALGGFTPAQAPPPFTSAYTPNTATTTAGAQLKRTAEQHPNVPQSKRHHHAPQTPTPTGNRPDQPIPIGSDKSSSATSSQFPTVQSPALSPTRAGTSQLTPQARREDTPAARSPSPGPSPTSRLIAHEQQEIIDYLLEWQGTKAYEYAMEYASREEKDRWPMMEKDKRGVTFWVVDLAEARRKCRLKGNACYVCRKDQTTCDGTSIQCVLFKRLGDPNVAEYMDENNPYSSIALSQAADDYGKKKK